MAVHRFHIAYTAATVVLLGFGNLYAAAAEPAAAEPAAAEPAAAEPAAAEPAETRLPASQQEPIYQVSNSPEEFAARFGWWGVSTSGSPTKVGEYQGLSPSSPFWDVEGLRSNGKKTVGFYATGPEDESTSANLHFYNGPSLTADVQYERFPHRLDHDSIAGFVPQADAKGPRTPASGPPYTGNPYSRDDLNLGQNYAIRVQEIRANFKGDINDNIKWRVNVFGIQKEGDRQARAMTHCAQSPQIVAGFTPQCHVLSQSQHILWQTNEVEPVIEMRLTDSLRFEYSRTMRQFTQSDGVVLNTYSPDTAFTPAGASTTGVYGLVPNSTTQIDRLKAHGQLGDSTDFYVLSYVGNTENEFRNTNRHFGGIDGRITNNSIDGLTLTGFGKTYTENTQAPTTALGQPLYLEPDLDDIDPPVNRDKTTYGVNGRWRPFFDEAGTLRSRFAVTGGYEYGTIRRTNADYLLRNTPPPFIQPDTDSNAFFVGVEEKFSKQLNAYLRYKLIKTDYPLYGVQPWSRTVDNALNTKLPTREDRIELGATWSPTDRFMLNGAGWFENASNHGPYADFDSNSFPFSLTTWYAVNTQWSFNGGYAYFPDHITQDITLGANANATPTTPFTSPWTYMQEASVVNVGANYAWSERLSFNGGVEYVRGLNVIANIPNNGSVSYSNIPGYSKVAVDTCRVSGGVDYLVRRNVSTYFRYNFYNYGDAVTSYDAGQAAMFLGGVSATF